MAPRCKEAVVLLLGPEGPGLRAELKECCDRWDAPSGGSCWELIMGDFTVI